jgi:hypothetical protein
MGWMRRQMRRYRGAQNETKAVLVGAIDGITCNTSSTNIDSFWKRFVGFGHTTSDNNTS